MNASVTLTSVSKKFPQKGAELPVLDSISFSLKEGEIVSILGRSGVGKTTLLNIIAGADTADTGKIEVNGRIGYVPQRDFLLPWRSVMKNVLLPLEIRHADNIENRNKAKAMLEDMDLGDSLDSLPEQISGGMRQKTSLVRAVIDDPTIYLFDESFSAIDFDTRLKLERKIREHIISTKKAGIFVTHKIEEGIAMADRVLVFEGKPAKIVYEAEFKIDEHLRDPLAIRKTTQFQEQFDAVWKVLSKTV